jgi:tetratricopeptide (TPR) repeat protein
MKQLLSFLFVLLVISSVTFAQQVDRAKEHLKANRLTEAKTTIDEFLKDPGNHKSATAWYTKAKIYNAISYDATLSKQYPSARMDAFNALKKYTETDDRMLIELQIDGYAPINEIYTGFYQTAANSFNQKSYEIAFQNFVNAITVSSFMTRKGWINLNLDTNSVLYAGVAAEKLNRFDDAVKYYGQLAEAKVAGDGFVEIYKWVANHYFEKKDLAQAKKFLALGREVYPGDPFWNSLELDMVREGSSKEALFAQYEKTIAAEPNNHFYRYNYAVELYQFGYNVDVSKRPANSDELIQKASAQLSRVLAINPEYVRGQLFAGQIIYNMGVDLTNKAKKTESDNVAALKAKALSKYDEALPYFLKVEQLLSRQTQLSADEKADLKEALDLTITIYDQKGDKAKLKEYQDKFNAVKN